MRPSSVPATQSGPVGPLGNMCRWQTHWGPIPTEFDQIFGEVETPFWDQFSGIWDQFLRNFDQIVGDVGTKFLWNLGPIPKEFGQILGDSENKFCWSWDQFHPILRDLWSHVLWNELTGTTGPISSIFGDFWPNIRLFWNQVQIPFRGLLRPIEFWSNSLYLGTIPGKFINTGNFGPIDGGFPDPRD